MSDAGAPRLPLRTKLFHGLGSVAYGVKDNGFSTFLLIFYNQVVGLDAKLVSLALMIALLIDALFDPIIGYLSDRTYTRWGRRLPWLYLAPIPLAFSWMMLWSPPDSLEHIFAYLVINAIVVRTLVSCCEVPSQSLVPELTNDYDERTVVTRFRLLFAWGGGLLTFFLANGVFLRADVAHKQGQLNADGYWYYGLAGAILMALSVLVSAMGQHRILAHLPKDRPQSTTVRRAMGEMWESFQHPAARILLIATLIGWSGTQMTYTISNFLYLYVWKLSGGAFALLPWMLLLSVLTAFFIVSPLQSRFDKKSVAIVCGVISQFFWLVPYVARYLDLWPAEGSDASTSLLFALIFVTNVNSVVVQICAQSMLADVVEASFVSTGRRTEGVFAAGWVFMLKCATALGIGITGLLVSWSGIKPKTAPDAVPDFVIDRLTLAYGGIVLVVAIVVMLLYKRFPITRADHEERLKQIAAAAAN